MLPRFGNKCYEPIQSVISQKRYAKIMLPRFGNPSYEPTPTDSIRFIKGRTISVMTIKYLHATYKQTY
jgi:hypothetical protein